jgi:subtilase family serine protease
LVFHGELTWDQGGGGLSPYEPRPAFQSSISQTVGAFRGVPDVAAVANPDTGVWDYDSYQTNGAPWNVMGGTSVGAPLWAGFVNVAGLFEKSSADELNLIYFEKSEHAGGFRDITNGGCGRHDSYLATTGWDQCTGFGTPITTGSH